MSEPVGNPPTVPSIGAPRPVASAQVASAQVASAQVAFYARRPDFRQLVMRGAMLELVTVGFYRFWLANDMRRHLWSHTAVEGDTLEYSGTAKELLIGFLFAIAILAPVYLLYFLAGLEAERAKAFAGTPLVLFFYFFSQFATYRARRYRVTRTIWRGVRFWMTGSGISYAWRAGLWLLLVIFSFGIALPWRQAALERFKMRYTSYGNLPGRFVGTGSEFFKRGWWLWLAIALLPVCTFGLAAIKMNVLAVILYVGSIVALPFIYAMYKAIEWRWWVSGIRFGSVYFESNMRRNALIDIYWKLIGWSCLLSSALGIWGYGIYGIVSKAIGVVGTPQPAAMVMQQYSFLIPTALGYVVYILAFWVLMRIYLIHDIWQRVAESTTVHDLGSADNVVGQGKLVGALGEGFADSLDVVGF